MSNPKTMLGDRLSDLKLQGINPTAISRLVKLSSHPAADPESYVEVARMEPLLASRILGVANSSWASPLRPVTRIDHAVNMLGIANVRALALAFCLECFHRSMELDTKDAYLLWQASLLKASAARTLAETVRPDATEEPFIAGLLQDLGVPLMLTIHPPYHDLLQNTQLTIDDQLQQERAIFGVDHVTVGSVIAYKLGLPTRYLTSILRHHAGPSHTTDDPTVSAEWIDSIVALLPHSGQAWNVGNMEKLDGILRRFWSKQWPDLGAFMKDISTQFHELANSLGKEINIRHSVDELLQNLAKANTTAVVNLVRNSVQNNQLRAS